MNLRDTHMMESLLGLAIHLSNQRPPAKIIFNYSHFVSIVAAILALNMSLEQSHALARQPWRYSTKIFHGRFYGRTNFWCKTVQFCATGRECLTTKTPSVSHAVQRSENRRKNSFLNYKSAALPLYRDFRCGSRAKLFGQIRTLELR